MLQSGPSYFSSSAPRLRLFGRESERATLRAALDGAFEGRGGFVLVQGEAGIGKTHLVESLAYDASAAGARVRWGRCYDGEGAPALWPWLQVLRAEIESRDAAALATLVAEAGPDVAHVAPEIRERLPQVPAAAPLDTPEARFRLFGSVTALLASAAVETPLVILLDDLHRADESSLRLLEFLVQGIAATRMLVVAAHRTPGDGPVDPPAHAALRDLARRATERIALAGLDRDGVAALLRAGVAAAVPDAVVDAGWVVTAGNPLFVGEMALDLGAHDRLQGRAHVDAAPMPAGIHEAIARHVARMSPRSTEVLRAASILGNEFTVALLEGLVPQPRPSLLDAVDAAMEARLVVQEPDHPGRYHFRHALIRHAVYETLGPAERRRLHRLAGEMLAARADEDEHLAEIAHHLAASGATAGGASASAYTRRAADRALSMLAFEEAERLYRLALARLAAEDPGDVRMRARILIDLGRALSGSGDGERAKATFLEAAAIARTIPSRELIAQAAIGYGGELAFPEAGARDDAHVTLLEDAISLWGEEDGGQHARLLVRLATALYFTDAPGRRIALCDRALAMARRVDDPDALADVLLATHSATSGPDNPRERVGIADALLRLANRNGDRRLAFRARAARIWDHLELGQIAPFEADVAACDELARESRQPSQIALVTSFRVTRATLKGRFNEAEALAAEVLENGRWLGQAAEAVFALELMMVRYLQGRLSELIDGFRAFVALHPGIFGARCALGLTYLQMGAHGDARAILAELMAHDLADWPRNGTFLPTCVQLADICAALGEQRFAATIYTALLPYADSCAAIPNAIAFIGSVSHYLGRLAATLGRHDDATRHLERAVAVHSAMGAEPWLALSRCEQAALLFAHGSAHDVARAATAIAQAVQTADALGMGLLAERARGIR